MSEYTSIKKDVLTRLEILLPELRERFGIETIGIFGSVARGEDTPESDVDVLYCFQKGRGGMFDLVGLHDYLVSVFQRPVDLVSVKYISPYIVQNVKSDAVLFGAMQAIEKEC